MNTTIYNSDCRDMAELADGTVHCVVTSPPYFGLRKYEGKQDLLWGGDKDCEHEWASDPIPGKKSGPHGPNATVGARFAQDAVRRRKPTNTCSLCGAWRGQFGLEPTIELYVSHTIELLREIRRVLRKDGVVFWDIGDSYASGRGTCFNPGGGANSFGKVRKASGVHPLNRGNISDLHASGLKSKDLCLIPFRVAFAAQNDGWWVRSVIIWNKPNPMPESVNGWRWEKHRIKASNEPARTRAGKLEGFRKHSGYNIEGAKWIDCPGCEKCLPNDGLVLCKGSWRPTSSYEIILMLTKSDDYYCDTDAVREPHKAETIQRYKYGYRESDRDKLGQSHHGKGYQRNDGSPIDLNAGRNLRDVWTFPTTPFPSQFVGGEKLDHFAVFPEKLPELCIKAATSEKGCCPKCGAPWSRVVDKKPSQFNIRVRDARAGRATPEEGYKATEEEIAGYPGNHPDMGYRQTIGWKPSCDCGLDNSIPCTVLDPFMGSGSTLLVATKLGRKSIGYDISESYCKMAVNRNRQGGL